MLIAHGNQGKKGSWMRVSEYFKLARSQATLDFVDVTLDTDLPVFVNPVAIKALPSEWGSECVSLLQHFF
jgi:hypothetical protein